MRIPKRVNDALDWAERHGRGLTVTVILIVVVTSSLFLPTLAVLVLGAVLGASVVYLRMSNRQRRLRTEIDDLLRQNGALRHQRTVLASGVIAAETQTTQALMVIPAEDAEDCEDIEPEAAKTRKLPVVPDEE